MALLDADEVVVAQPSPEATLRLRLTPGWLSQYKVAMVAFPLTVLITCMAGMLYFAAHSGSPNHRAVEEAPATSTTEISIPTQEPPTTVRVVRPEVIQVERTITVESTVSTTTTSTSPTTSSAAESTSVMPSSSPVSSVASSTTPPPNETPDPVPSSTETTEAAPPSETS